MKYGVVCSNVILFVMIKSHKFAIICLHWNLILYFSQWKIHLFQVSHHLFFWQCFFFFLPVSLPLLKVTVLDYDQFKPYSLISRDIYGLTDLLYNFFIRNLIPKQSVMKSHYSFACPDFSELGALQKWKLYVKVFKYSYIIFCYLMHNNCITVIQISNLWLHQVETPVSVWLSKFSNIKHGQFFDRLEIPGVVSLDMWVV